jgi:hypothetical protein
MGAKSEVEGYIYSSWKQKEVADWVIKRLPLLELGGSCSPVPILDISIENGLDADIDRDVIEVFKNKNKFVISGGMEGTRGHELAVRDMHEVRALKSDSEKSMIAVLLEPDSYIRERKQREPILNLEQRASLWSTSGLTDAVVKLPQKSVDMIVREHYERIHAFIGPAEWCASYENPAWKDIVTRHGQEEIDLLRVFTHRPEVHATFLDLTKAMNAQELIEALREYSYELACSTSSKQSLEVLPANILAPLIFDELCRGLDR